VPTLGLTGYLFERNRQRNVARLEQALAARSRLLSHVSHEMRTPLNGILGLTQALRLQAGGGLAAEPLELIHQSGETLLCLINDLLDVARAEAGTGDAVGCAFDLTRLVERSVALHQPRAGAAAISLALECRAAPLWVVGDAVRVQQVLGYLLANALRHGGGTPITVALRASAEGGGHLRVELSVADHGPGMSVEESAALFEPLAPLESLGGGGRADLGLHLSKTIARRLGGALSVRSAPGQGACFTLCLSLAPAEPVTQARSPTLPQLTGRVLVVDDNAVNRKVAQALLTKLGLTVVTAESGEAALSWLSANPVQLVLMDLQMPGLDGFETTRALRARGFTTPIVALTASAQPETPAQCAAAGMNDCLFKPLRLEQAAPLLAGFIVARAA
jgi:CheY-like chemotaxis protein/anti-sigma regulatory factor (Ser/Thr protein kinase)